MNTREKEDSVTLELPTSKDTLATIQPVILSGGAGTRLWPLSREALPKQFLPLLGEGSLLQQTCKRVHGAGFDAPIMLVNKDHRFLVGEQLQDIGIVPAALVLEPCVRNTAPAALIAALLAGHENPGKLLLLLPSDHLLKDTDAFKATVRTGAHAARAGHIVTFGIRPDRPETGFGYIATSGADQVLDVARFVEKPTLEVAQGYLRAGHYFWNAGIFLFSARTLIAEFERLAPDLLALCRDALAGAREDLDFTWLDEAAYGRCQSVSLDYAVMEQAQSIKCVPLSADWSDLGTWPALWEAADKDEAGNATYGDVILQQTSNSYAYSEDALLCVLGLQDVIAVATRDAVLVASRGEAQAVKEVVDALKAAGRDEAVVQRRVYRPWGWYESLSQGEGFQVKCLMVKPGGQLSLQSHCHRAEHWVVVSGTAKVTVADKTTLMGKNESTYIPQGAKHRLENPGKVPAFLIEVQSGDYLGEDDIVRYEDAYHRT